MENRSLDTRRDNDNFKIPSITIYDIDFAILSFLKNSISPQVERNGNVINVPVMFSNGEKWKQVQKDGILRDANSQILVPLILIKRNSITADDRFPTLKIGGENSPIIYYPVQQLNNQHDLARMNNDKSFELYAAPIPTYVRVSYELLVWADTTTHLNTIVESIIPHSKKPWGDQLQFVCNVQDYNFETVNNVGEDRALKCVIPLQVDGYLQNEYDLKESTVKKSYTIKRIDFKSEVEEEGFYIDYKPKIIAPANSRMIRDILNNTNKDE